jgi:hypothetical protein
MGNLRDVWVSYWAALGQYAFQTPQSDCARTVERLKTEL